MGQGDGIGIGADRNASDYEGGLNPEPTGENSTVQRNDDVSEETKTTLGDYLSRITKDPGFGNTFKIAPGSTSAAVIGDAGGFPGAPSALDFGPLPGGAENVYAPHSGDAAFGDLEKYSNSDSGLKDPRVAASEGVSIPTLGDIVRKGRSAGAGLSGHELYQPINEAAVGVDRSGLYDGAVGDSEPTEPVLKRTSAILTANRFHPGATFDQAAEKNRPESTFIQDAEGAVGIERNKRMSSLQRQYGAYDPQAPALNTDQAALIGKSLSLRSTGEFFARGDGANPLDPAIATSVLLPGEAQIGVTRIDTEELDVNTVFREVIGEDLHGNLQSGGFPDNRQIDDSYGNLNNCQEHFDALLPLGMITLGVALLLAMQIAIRAFLALITLITFGKTGKSDMAATDARGRPFLGDNRKIPNPAAGLLDKISDPFKLLGLRPVNFEYNKAVNEGIAVFFGGDTSGPPGTDVLGVSNPIEQFTRIAETPGFYSIFIRNISRSLNTIANSIANADLSPNPIAVIEGLGSVIDTIARSKVISALNIFATIGERSLVLKSQGVNCNDLRDDPRLVSKIDKLPLDTLPPLHAMKSRGRNSLQLAWRTGASTSALLLPASVGAAGKAFTGDGGVSGLNPAAYGAIEPGLRVRPGQSLPSSLDPKVIIQKEPRLSHDVVREVEAALEAEYVPFYFHDIRTNEIISFHAFLEAISEEYAVNYEQVSAYGRVDSVKIYRDTQRTISMTFTAMATSYKDFDEMWVKINKLTSMIYPQYTQGNVILNDPSNAESDRFIQPFSQVQAGSPLIRLRLGDLFKSNYSRFALARLFGLGSAHFQTNKVRMTTDNLSEDDQNEFNKKLSNLLSAVLAGDSAIVGVTVKLRPKGSIGSSDPSDGYQPNVDGGGLGDVLSSGLASAIGLPGEDPIPPLVVTSPVRVKILGTKDEAASVTESSKFIVQVIDPDEAVLTEAAKSTYIASFSDIIFDNEVIEALKESLGLTATPDIITDGTIPSDITSFFDPANNVIVRSFEQGTRGKGLAGVITALSFDHQTVVWETERYGSRAPKQLRATLTFAPIHDIPPGISADGFNRAPIYNVGAPMNAVAGDAYDSAGAGQATFDSAHRALTSEANKRDGET